MVLAFLTKCECFSLCHVFLDWLEMTLTSNKTSFWLKLFLLWVSFSCQILLGEVFFSCQYYGLTFYARLNLESRIARADSRCASTHRASMRGKAIGCAVHHLNSYGARLNRILGGKFCLLYSSYQDIVDIFFLKNDLVVDSGFKKFLIVWYLFFYYRNYELVDTSFGIYQRDSRTFALQ